MPSWPRMLSEITSNSSANVQLLPASPSISSLNSVADRQKDFDDGKRGSPIPLQGLSSSGASRATTRRRQFRDNHFFSTSSSGSSFDSEQGPAMLPEFRQALEKGQTDAVDSLLQKNHELIHSKNTQGRGVIHVAASASQAAMIAHLIRKSADINETDSEGNTALHAAVERSDVSMIAALLKMGADIKRRNNHGDTAFHTAVRAGRLDALQQLLALAPNDVDAPGSNEETALDLAATLNKVDLVALLVEHRDRTFGQNGLENLHIMHLAALRHAPDVLKWLLKNGTSYATPQDLLKLEDEEKGTPLHAAVHSGDETAVKLLLDQGASITAQTRELSTPLHLACSQGSLNIVNLICNGVDREILTTALTMKDDHGMTPLHRYLEDAGGDLLGLARYFLAHESHRTNIHVH